MVQKINKKLLKENLEKIIKKYCIDFLKISLWKKHRNSVKISKCGCPQVMLF
jgi:hypothetical protein